MENDDLPILDASDNVVGDWNDGRATRDISVLERHLHPQPVASILLLCASYFLSLVQVASLDSKQLPEKDWLLPFVVVLTLVDAISSSDYARPIEIRSIFISPSEDFSPIRTYHLMSWKFGKAPS